MLRSPPRLHLDGRARDSLTLVRSRGGTSLLEPWPVVPLRPLPILWHAQGWGRRQVEDILRNQRREGVHNAPLGHHPRGAALVVKQQDRPVALPLI